MDIGNQWVSITGGSGDVGTGRPMKGHTGAIRIMTTIAKAGECTRDIGTMKTTTTAAGETMIMIGTIMTTTTDRCAALQLVTDTSADKFGSWQSTACRRDMFAIWCVIRACV
jgi:hypothetical protein